MSLNLILSSMFLGLSIAHPVSRQPKELTWGNEIAGGIDGSSSALKLPETVAPLSPNDSRWPGGIVYYRITDGFSDEQLNHIRTAQHLISNRSDYCIRFHQVDENQVQDYLVFTKTEDSCSSTVGREGGRQTMELCDDCFESGHGRIAHELMHVIGFHHEHVRNDRDSYIIVHENLILPDKIHDFQVLEVDTFDVPYDYDSILHYPRNGFGINDNDETITPKDPEAKIGQRDHLSDGDVAKIRKFYGCI